MRQMPTRRQSATGGPAGLQVFFHNGEVGNEDKHYLCKPLRSAVYCDGDVDTMKQMLLLLDGFVSWYGKITQARQQEFPTLPKIEIELPTGFAVDFAGEDDEGADMLRPYEICTTDVTQTRVTDVPPPCYPARLLVATIEAPSKELSFHCLDW